MRNVFNLNDEWLISADPENRGKNEGYARKIREDAKPIPVPGIIQQVLFDYHGVVWYYRQTENPFYGKESGKRIILSFGAVDYYSEVFADGEKLYANEGPEKPFDVDVTDSFKGKKTVLVALRVINPPVNEIIEGFERKKLPRRNIEEDFFRAGASYNAGGITLPVTLKITEDTYIKDIYAKNNIHTGKSELFVTTMNHRGTQKGKMCLKVFENTKLSPCLEKEWDGEILPGEQERTAEFTLENPLLWSVDEPNLYRYEVTLKFEDGSETTGEITTGFREFLVKDGFFFLNGKRLFLKSAHTGNNFPIGVNVAALPGMQFEDFRQAKASGFNCIRFIATAATPEQLDYCDNLGMMVYQETYASWYLNDSPRAEELFNDSYLSMVKRDRNHPSLTIFGLLNETNAVDVFFAAKKILPDLRKLDDTRLVIFSSGRFDLCMKQERWKRDIMLGSFANPGSTQWECQWGDEGDPERNENGQPGDCHNYMGVPLDTSKNSLNRVAGRDAHGPVLISEFGVGSQLDVINLCKEFQMNGTDVRNPDYSIINGIREKYVVDFEKYNCYDVYTEPEDFLQDSLKHNAFERRLSFDIIRSNPRCCGYNVTGLLDHSICGEGPFTLFRKFKPGHYDAFRDGFAKLRWCLFVSNGNVYSDEEIELEAVLANEDVLRDGDYTAVFAVTDERGATVKKWERHFTLPINDKEGYPKLAMQIFDEKTVLNVPAGKYVFKAYLKNGGDPLANERTFYVSERQQHKAPTEVFGFCLPEKAVKYLNSQYVDVKEIDETELESAEKFGGKKILVGNMAAEKALSLAEKLMNISRAGGHVVYLDPLTFDDTREASKALPLENKTLLGFPAWVYHKDVIVKDTEITADIQHGFAEWDYFCGVYPHITVISDTMPERTDVMFFAVGNFEWVTGRNNGSYHSGVLIGKYGLEKGSFTLNTFKLLDDPGHRPAGDSILYRLATI